MIGQRGSNGLIVIVMTPREAVEVLDHTLDPADFPWQGSASQQTVRAFRECLYGQVFEGAAELMEQLSTMPADGQETQQETQ